MRIARKMSLSFVVVVVALMVSAGSVFYFASKRHLENEIFAHLSTAVQSRASHIETFVQKHVNWVELLAADATLTPLLASDSSSGSYAAAKDMASRRLVDAVNDHDDVTSVSLFDRNGAVVLSSNASSLRVDGSDNPVFVRSRATLFIRDIQLCEDCGNLDIVIGVPIYVDGGFSGVIAGHVDLAGLSEIALDTTGLGATGEVYLANRDGFLVTPSRFISGGVLKQKVESLNVVNCPYHREQYHVAERHVPSVIEDYRGVEVLEAHEYIPEMGWCVLAKIDASEALAPIKELKALGAIIALCVPLLAWFTSAYISRVITRPIRRLREGARLIGSGDLGHRVRLGTGDEAGELGQAFDQMAENLSRATTTIDELNQEIEERKRAQEALAESEAQLRAIFEAASDGILLADSTTKQFYAANPAISRMLGYSPDELKGMGVMEIHPEEDLPFVVEQFERQARHEIELAKAIPVKRKDGSVFYADIASRPVELGGKVYLLGMIRDITCRRLAEEQLAVYTKEIEKFNRLAVDRELRMIELKEEINSLLSQSGREQKYHIVK